MSTQHQTPFWRSALGRPADWNLRRPALGRPRPGIHWSGPATILTSLAVSWFAFKDATGDGNVAFGLFIGAVSILLMAWSFVLALRLQWLERFFGGLDSMYRVHRWAGVLAIIAMYLHTSIEPEIEGGFRGASRSIAKAAEDLAETGQTMLYILVGISLLRWLPYRWWRWTHKLLGVPFAFASWHFFTAMKPYENNSPWGWYFATFMVGGLAAYVWRVVVRDMLMRGSDYEVSAMETTGTTTALSLKPKGKPLRHEAGQFAVLKIEAPGLREPHIFTIASSPEDPHLKFFIRDLGDWTARLQGTDITGTRVRVEGPYGEFAPTRAVDGPTVWIAGGVGITPFLSAIAGLRQPDTRNRPTLFYCVRSEQEATALAELRLAEASGLIDLEICSSSDQRRFTADLLNERYGPQGLQQAHVAVCGPAGLISTATSAAHALGARRVEHEDFDIRQGFGPDLSKRIDQLTQRLTPSR